MLRLGMQNPYGLYRRFPDSSVGKESRCNAGDTGSIPGLGRSTGERIGYHPVFLGFPGGYASKESTCNAGDLGSIPGLGRSPGEENGNSLLYFTWRILWIEEPRGL